MNLQYLQLCAMHNDCHVTMLGTTCTKCKSQITPFAGLQTTQRMAMQAADDASRTENGGQTPHRFSLIMLSRSRSFRACSGSTSPSTTGLQSMRTLHLIHNSVRTDATAAKGSVVRDCGGRQLGVGRLA